MKPNIVIATFLNIQIVRNHIPKNLDAGVMWILLYQTPPYIIVYFAKAHLLSRSMDYV